MAEIPCDHTSVGVLAFREGKLLLIDRRRPPEGLAPPAGHLDKHDLFGDSEEKRHERTAIDELREETGLSAISLILVGEGRKENPCRRPEGSWHYWRIYQAEVTGELKPSATETRGHLWCSRKQMEILLAGRSVQVARGAARLEPVWREWLRELNILDRFPM